MPYRAHPLHAAAAGSDQDVEDLARCAAQRLLQQHLAPPLRACLPARWNSEEGGRGRRLLRCLHARYLLRHLPPLRGITYAAPRCAQLAARRYLCMVTPAHFGTPPLCHACSPLPTFALRPAPSPHISAAARRCPAFAPASILPFGPAIYPWTMKMRRWICCVLTYTPHGLPSRLHAHTHPAFLHLACLRPWRIRWEKILWAPGRGGAPCLLLQPLL